MNSAASFKLHLLGAFGLERDGTSLHLPTRKIESLLAYLALHPQAHSREKLAALFWGDVRDESARHSLNVALNALRKEIAHELVLTDRTSVQLNPEFPLWVDAREIDDLRLMVSDLSLASSEQIQNLKSKIENYRADLLPDFYDDWILLDREQYRELYVNALLALTQHYRAESAYARAIEYAERVLILDNANERAHQHLMLCFAVTGERHKALEQYETCVRALREELAVEEPARETIALYDWIRQAPTSPSFAARLTNLPLPLTSFIGRTKELQAVKERLTQARLVTLTGAGGSGKTRVAIQVGIEALNPSSGVASEHSSGRVFHDGVWWIELAALSDGERVAETVVRALGIPMPLQQDLVEALVRVLRDQERLLIFDNCEHLLDACARLIEQLLQTCSELVILATSREPLNLRGEVVFLVPTLTVPNPNAPSLTALLMQYEAVHLFVERAQAVNPQFALNDTNAHAVTQICARLDGIPLALELAAARTRAMSATEIAAHLDDRFQLLTRGERTALPRQQTLHATLDWSYNLLTEDERALFRLLTVFEGGFSLDAVAYISNEVRGQRTDAIELVSRLVEKSLVFVRSQNEATRYFMLETIREFAREKLVANAHAGLNAASEQARARQAHFEYFSRLVKEWRGTWESKWNESPHSNRENLATALTWAMETSLAPGASGEIILQMLEFAFLVSEYLELTTVHF